MNYESDTFQHYSWYNSGILQVTKKRFTRRHRRSITPKPYFVILTVFFNVSAEYLEYVPTGGLNVTPFLNVYVKLALSAEPLFACNGVAFHGLLGRLSGFL